YADVLLAKSLSDHDSPWQASFGTGSEILGLLKSNGFISIEVKLPANCPILELKRILETISSFGFAFSFHAPGSLGYPDNTAVFTRYITDIATLVYSHSYQTSGFVVHGLSCYHLSKVKSLSPTVHFLQELLEGTAGLDIDFTSNFFGMCRLTERCGEEPAFPKYYKLLTL
ncbi:hypothetical protein KAH55_03120, partial [bacterium]|nr:hypothetical protein [bacterium]